MSQPKFEPSLEGRPSEALVPQHIAIIMDGNGRWAKSRNMPRVFGHRQGVEALRHAVEAAGELGVKYLTVFGFSTENWSRPADEVEALLELLRLYVNRDLDRLAREGVRVRVVGERATLTPDIIRMIERAENSTRQNERLNLTIAFNYGGQAEIVAAAKKMAHEVEEGRLRAADITLEHFSSFLHTKELPAPDVLIRTSGEKRISNFLLWQCAYTEFVFQDVLWPDFSKTNLEAAIEEFRSRDRRYGGRDNDASA